MADANNLDISSPADVQEYYLQHGTAPGVDVDEANPLTTDPSRAVDWMANHWYDWRMAQPPLTAKDAAMGMMPMGMMGTIANAAKAYKAAIALGHTTQEAELLASKVAKLPAQTDPYPSTLAKQFSHNLKLGYDPDISLIQAKMKWPNDLSLYKQEAPYQYTPVPDDLQLAPVDHDPFAGPGVPTFGPGKALSTSMAERQPLAAIPQGFDMGAAAKRISNRGWRVARGEHLPGDEWKEFDQDIQRYLSALDLPLAPHELEAIRNYQGGSFEINNAFRQGYASPPAEHLYNALMQSELPHDLLVHRAVNAGAYTSDAMQALHNFPPREGDIIGSKGFASTTLTPGAAETFLSQPPGPNDTNYMFSIALPRGSHALPLFTGEPGNALDLEREMILAPGQKFRVVGTEDYPKHSAKHVALEALPHGEMPQVDPRLRQGRGMYNAIDESQSPLDKEVKSIHTPHDVLAYLASLAGLAGGAAATLVPVDHNPFSEAQ